jgi:putative multiple sugar transport system permease protein
MTTSTPTSTSTSAAAPASADGGLGFLKANLRDYGMLLSLVVIMAFFQVMTDGTLMQPLNLTNLILQNSYIVIMALGMLLVIVAGYIDLSVGSVCGFIGALAAVLMVQFDWHWLPASLVCLVCGGAIGAAQGWFIAWMRIPSFIVTLAGMLVFKGLALALLQGQSVGPFPPQFQLLSSGFIPDPFGGDGLRIFSLVLGMAVAALLVLTKLRERAAQVAHGLADEPLPFFAAKIAVFVVLIVVLAWQLATYKGLPNVLIVMALLMLLYDFVTRRIVGYEVVDHPTENQLVALARKFFAR